MSFVSFIHIKHIVFITNKLKVTLRENICNLCVWTCQPSVPDAFTALSLDVLVGPHARHNQWALWPPSSPLHSLVSPLRPVIRILSLATCNCYNKQTRPRIRMYEYLLHSIALRPPLGRNPAFVEPMQADSYPHIVVKYWELRDTETPWEERQSPHKLVSPFSYSELER